MMKFIGLNFKGVQMSISLASITSCLHTLVKLVPFADNLISYLAWTYTPNYDYQSAYNSLLSRTADPDHLPRFNISPTETQVFRARFKLLNTNNRAYSLATKLKPTVQDLEEFAEIKPCWSMLFPVKLYMLQNPAIAKQYRGLQPFGQQVIKWVNKFYPPVEGAITVSPTFKHHIHLRDLTNWLTDLSGETTSWINTKMYIEGQDVDGLSVNDDE